MPRRALALRAWLVATGVAFVILAVAAVTVDYFPLDLTITRFIQSRHAAWFDGLMFALSWIGFMPQIHVLAVAIAIGLALRRRRWEAMCSLFAALGLALAGLVKLVIARPRPGADLVHVVRTLGSSAFPSGHVVEATAWFGFLIYLALALLAPSARRTALIALLGSLIALMGISRIHQGHHWFSDVLGGYLLGSLWLALTIRIYRSRARQAR